MRWRVLGVGIFLFLFGCGSGDSNRTLTVFAAASLGTSLDEFAKEWTESTGVEVRASYAASSTLARQIEAGASADVYISASSQWMRWLDERDRVVPGSRRAVFGNELCLIAPMNRGFDFNGRTPLARAFEGRLAIADPAHVPAGMYAQEALSVAGWWDELVLRIVGAQDVRGALKLVERGECGAGIVYRTDVLGNERVVEVAKVPGELHSPIVYPAAVVAGGNEALGREFLSAMEERHELFTRYGFTRLASALVADAP